MAWFSGRLDLGNLDLAGAVNKLSESVKNIEKNFDTALGLEEKSDSSTTTATNEASGLWPSTTDRKTLFNPVMSFMGQKSEKAVEESVEKAESSKSVLPTEEVVKDSAESTAQCDVVPKEPKEETKDIIEETKSAEEARNVDDKPSQMISAEEQKEEARAVDVNLDSAMETKVELEEQRSVTRPGEGKAEVNSPDESSKVNEHDQETSPEILQKNIPEEESS